MDPQAHWEEVYRRKRADEVSWYRPHLERSLAFIRSGHPPHDARIVDIGGGASTLVDDLLADGFRNLAVVDLAEAALAVARARLGSRAADVDWIAGDVTTPLFADASVDVWHDRAVFHFMVREEDRQTYLATLRRAVRPGGHAIIATFAENGPEKCSGLPVRRWAPADLASEVGPELRLVESLHEEHATPAGRMQAFQFSRFLRL